MHSVSSATGSEQLEYVRQRSETLFAPEVPLAEKLDRLFELETAEFELEHAFFSRIDTDAGTQRFDVVHGARGDLVPDNTVELGTTYCRKTIQSPDGTLAVSDAQAEGWGDDPAYERFDLGSYLGTTVVADDEPYGTLCYANTDPRADAITDEEVALVEIESQWLGALLDKGTRPPADVSAVPSDRLDPAMDALRTAERRVVLSSLLETGATSVESIALDTDGEATRELLYHSSLPRLADDGYVTWDVDSGTVARGPNFTDVESVLRSVTGGPDTGSQ